MTKYETTIDQNIQSIIYCCCFILCEKMQQAVFGHFCCTKLDILELVERAKYTQTTYDHFSYKYLQPPTFTCVKKKILGARGNHHIRFIGVDFSSPFI